MGWLGTWHRRVKVTIDHNDITSLITWFPVLIHLSSLCGINSQDLTAIFDEVGANYLKIAVTKDDGETQLYVEIEEWDSVNEEAWLWVSRDGWDIASGSDTEFYIYYDNTQSDNTTYIGLPNSSPAEAVWDSNFKLVCHMRDDPDTSHVRDSTGNDNDGTKLGANEPQVTASGEISDAQQFDAVNDKINFGNPAEMQLDNSTLFTISAWIKRLSVPAGNYAGIIGKYQRYAFRISSSGRIDFGVREFGTANIDDITIGTVGVGTFALVTVTYDGTKLYAYLNDAYVTEQAVSVTFPADNTIDWETDDIYSGGTTHAELIIDEIQISRDVIRTGAWVKASYETQRDHLLSFSTPEALPLGIILTLKRRKLNLEVTKT